MHVIIVKIKYFSTLTTANSVIPVDFVEHCSAQHSFVGVEFLLVQVQSHSVEFEHLSVGVELLSQQ